MYTIWIVEDEQSITDVLSAYLKKSGYNVCVFNDGLKAMQAVDHSVPDLMILDIDLPIYTGIDILNALRKKSDNPVIFLTSSSSEASRILGFELGADDYVTKPFSPVELMHRVKKILQRVYGVAKKLTVNNTFWIDVQTYTLYCDKDKIELTANEVKVLITLVKEKPKVLSRQQIIEYTFGIDYEATDRNIDTYIKNIRQKIEHHPKTPQYIKTKYGIGYYFGG